MASIVSMKSLLESGVHFGHRTNKWNPSMRPYIFTERNGIHIIDLQQTVKALNTAYNKVVQTVAEGGNVLFVGTKRQAQETIRDEAVRCGMPYVVERWLGGTLTNWSTIYQRIQELERLEKMRDTGEIDRLTKKEGLLIEREIERLNTRLSGLRTLKAVPTLLFVVDVSREETAVHEANLKDIPVLALVDTNCSPANIDYVIPSNDDAIRAIKLLVGKIADAVLEGKATRKDDDLEAAEAQERQAQATPRPRRRVELDVEELGENELLGEATLAKMAPKVEEKVVEAPAVETPTVETPTVETPAVEETTETSPNTEA
jgi:small subunit ribosomal protein S2